MDAADARAELDRLIRRQASETAARVQAGIDGLTALREAFEYFADRDHAAEHPDLAAAANRVLAGVRLTSAAMIVFLRTCQRERERGQEAATGDPAAV